MGMRVRVRGRIRERGEGEGLFTKKDGWDAFYQRMIHLAVAGEKSGLLVRPGLLHRSTATSEAPSRKPCSVRDVGGHRQDLGTGQGTEFRWRTCFR